VFFKTAEALALMISIYSHYDEDGTLDSHVLDFEMGSGGKKEWILK
jgi:hypothetical protein